MQLGHQAISIVDSNIKPDERTQRIIRFAPKANGKPDMPMSEQLHLLISTDVLSEGQNLQDAEVIINYDLHWNPVRMVQRIGRLDRIGSPYEIIYVYNFFPEEELEELLGLLQRLYDKLNAINRAVGLDASVIGELPNPMEFNILRRIEQQDKSVLNELEDASELTIGEFLKQDLLEFLKKLGEDKLTRIPLGIGTARKKKDGPAGFFAAFRNPHTNQSYWIFYDEEKGRFFERRLEAIRHIRCKPEELAEPLPEDFDALSLIQKTRKYIWNRIRAAELKPLTLPFLQRQIVNWLHALPPSAERNYLLQYFEAGALAEPQQKELRHLWRKRSASPQQDWLKSLLEFAKSHPHSTSKSSENITLAPESEEELECIAWMKVM